MPTGTAFFGTSNITNLSFSAATTTIGGWTFNAGASNYNFTNGRSLTFNGAGIVIDGGSASVTNNSGGILQFFDTSKAGSGTITNTSIVRFFNTSTAGDVTFTSNTAGTPNFNAPARPATPLLPTTLS